MRFNRVQFSLLLVYLSIGVSVAWAGTQTSAADEKLEVQGLIRMIQSSPQKLNYSGTFVYQQANQIRTSKITHHADANGELEKLEILDGNSREYIRKNDEVSCYLPDSKTIQVEKNVTQEVFPALFSHNAQSLPDVYSFKKGEPNRVAGLECQTYSLTPKDGSRYGYKLCAEKQSGLLLRVQTVNSRDEVIEQIAFTQLKLGDVDKNKLKPSFQNLNQWNIENLTVQSNIVSGWVVKSLPVGFIKIKEMKRVISSPASSLSDKKAVPSHQVIQMIFSDGMATISVFIEPDLERRNEGSLQQGAMAIMTKRQGNYWLTVIGEVPVTAIRQVINSIELKSK
ncbi:MucB/RseB C-terminal domain-containing protein [Undibacterium sp. Dicai25W]|uniref:MucB/RseB C-terminal domain-containing protein n=1 Tax=Undibacterium sp. Dicai25W TaxID=3413034 RepID=UPI003BEFC337